MFELFQAERMAAEVNGEPAGDAIQAAVDATRRSGLIREVCGQILASVIGHQPAESEWSDWLDTVQEEVLTVFARNLAASESTDLEAASRVAACLAMIDSLWRHGIGHDPFGHWTWLN